MLVYPQRLEVLTTPVVEKDSSFVLGRRLSMPNKPVAMSRSEGFGWRDSSRLRSFCKVAKMLDRVLGSHCGEVMANLQALDECMARKLNIHNCIH